MHQEVADFLHYCRRHMPARLCYGCFGVKRRRYGPSLTMCT
jgi:hypothetical protein